MAARLKTEINTPEMAERIVAAFDALYGDTYYSGCEAVYEHGQWWVLATDSDEETHTYSVCDAEGPPSLVVDGFSFEEV